MNIAIIKNEENNYYVKLKTIDEALQCSVVCASDQKIYYMDELEIKKLFSDMFSGDLKYLYTANNIKIYEDEAGNKRYFKNGIEDYYKFFKYNGKNAIMHEVKNDDNTKTNSKRYRLRNKAEWTITAMSIFAIILMKVPSIRDETIDKLFPLKIKLHNYITEEKIDNDISVQKLIDNILNSNIELSQEKKEYLANEDFITDVLDIANNQSDYSINENTKTLKYRYFTEEEKQNSPNKAGQYNVNLNEIAVKDDSEAEFKRTGPHEFVHLLQDNNSYLYIREACAELCSKEYYGKKVDAYVEEVVRVCILMEIIGPQPVLECNFKGNTKSFENAIHKNLDEESADRLLELFKMHPYDDKDEMPAVNEEIDKLLDKMYQNKYGFEYERDKAISILLRGTDIQDRFYFNQRSENFNRKIIENSVENSRAVIDKEDIEEYIVEISTDITKEQYDIKHNNPEEGVIYKIDCKIPNGYKQIEDGKINLLGTSECLTLEEAVRNGILEITDYRKIKDFSFKTFEEFDEFSKNPDYSTFFNEYDNNKQLDYVRYIKTKDGITYHYLTIENGNLVGTVSSFKSSSFPSVKDKFPEQIKYHIDKEIKFPEQIEYQNDKEPKL